MKDEVSSHAAELNSDHRDVDPSRGAGLGGFVIPHQSPVMPQPADGAFHDPVPGQDFKSLRSVGAFDHRDRQLGTPFFDPLPFIRTRY
jgi:hypothetical protein